MLPLQQRRLCLAWPFTFLTINEDKLYLVAGEDLRYEVTIPGLALWLPGFLEQLDESRQVADYLDTVPVNQREVLLHLLDRLYSERILIDAKINHHAVQYAPYFLGQGEVYDYLTTRSWLEAPQQLMVLCQDRFDEPEALAFNQKNLAKANPWLWTTTAPMSRGFVSPVFLPDVGPCLACLLQHFRRRSPIPEIYDFLAHQAQSKDLVKPTPFAATGIAILAQLVLWKLKCLNESVAPSALYQLHVLEIGSYTITTHQVWADPTCVACSQYR